MPNPPITPAQTDALAREGEPVTDVTLLRQAAAAGRLRIRSEGRPEGADTDAGMVWPIEIELPCVNGLSCWFTIGNLYTPDAAARGYTDGALSDELAHDFAAHIIRSLSPVPTVHVALAKLAEIPAVGSEERWRWLVEAEWHGIKPWTESRCIYCGLEVAVLTLMSEARKQGQRDVLSATPLPNPRKGQEETPCRMTVEETAAQACYAVTVEAVRPSFKKWPGGWTPQTWDELKEIERELHRNYARAALSTIRASEEDR